MFLLIKSSVSRLIASILSICLLFSFSGVSIVEADSMSGSGTSSNPYVITTAAELASIATGNLSANYILANNIDVSGYTYWTPIGTCTTPFTGVFNGNGYTISGIKIATAYLTSYSGLFGALSGATVTDCVISANIGGKVGVGYVGGVAGNAVNSTISNIKTTGSISSQTGTTGVARLGFGGIVGCSTNSTYFQDACVMSQVQCSNYVDLDCGGIVGSSTSDNISYCYSTAEIEAECNAGGLIGLGVSTVVDSCYATGQVQGGISSYFGGFIGNATGSCTITNCYATGNVSGSGAIGGFVGQLATMCKNATDSIYNCYAKGNVSGSGEVGGFIGFMHNDSFALESEVLSNTYSIGKSTDSNKKYGGAFVGSVFKESIVKSYVSSSAMSSGFKLAGYNTSSTVSVTSMPLSSMSTASFCSTLNSAVSGLPISNRVSWTQSSSVNNGYPTFGYQINPNLTTVAVNVTQTPVSLSLSLNSETDPTVATFSFKDGSGNAVPNTDFYGYMNGVKVFSGTTDSLGNYSYSIPNTTAPGTNTLVVTSIDGSITSTNTFTESATSSNIQYAKVSVSVPSSESYTVDPNVSSDFTSDSFNIVNSSNVNVEVVLTGITSTALSQNEVSLGVQVVNTGASDWVTAPSGDSQMYSGSSITLGTLAPGGTANVRMVGSLLTQSIKSQITDTGNLSFQFVAVV